MSGAGSRYALHKWIEDDDTFQQVHDVGALDVAEDSNSRVWITDFGHGFRMVKGTGREARPQGSGLRLLPDRRGNLWVATIGEGLWRVQTNPAQSPTVEKASLSTGSAERFGAGHHRRP